MSDTTAWMDDVTLERAYVFARGEWKNVLREALEDRGLRSQVVRESALPDPDVVLQEQADEPDELHESKKTAGYSATPSPLSTSTTSNWVARVGGLPNYIQHIAKALIRDGKSESTAIATAIAAVKRWAAGGGDVGPEVKAAAAKAVAEWESKKAAAHAESGAKAVGKKAVRETTAVEEAWSPKARLAAIAARRREGHADEYDKRVTDFFKWNPGANKGNAEGEMGIARVAGVPVEHVRDMHRRGLLKRSVVGGSAMYGLAAKSPAIKS